VSKEKTPRATPDAGPLSALAGVFEAIEVKAGQVLISGSPRTPST
jgi:hypothetical protein